MEERLGPDMGKRCPSLKKGEDFIFCMSAPQPDRPEITLERSVRNLPMAKKEEE
jgi:hypothetical protein